VKAGYVHWFGLVFLSIARRDHMHVVSDEEFKSAVETAKLSLIPLNNPPKERHPVALAIFCDQKTSWESPIVDHTLVRLSTHRKGVYYRIKLYEDDLIVEGQELGDELRNGVNGGLSNKRLVTLAKENSDVFDDLCEQLAYEIDKGYKISSIFSSFIAEVLRGDIVRPRAKRQQNNHRKFSLLFAIRDVFNSHELKLTRNDESKNKRSVLDAVSLAAKSLGHNCEYSTLKKDIYPLRKTMLDWPDF
jgi:hypothetical protein